LVQAFFATIEQMITCRRTSSYRPLVTSLVGLGAGLLVAGPLGLVGALIGHKLGAYDQTIALCQQIDEYCTTHGIDTNRPTTCTAHDMAQIQQILYTYYATNTNDKFGQIAMLKQEYNHLYQEQVTQQLQRLLHDREQR
jgi:hypothetical protein